MAETIQFKIDGEWLTEFVRKRVYQEGLDFNEGIEIFRASFPALSYDIARELLVGTKKLTGVNEFYIESDDRTADYLLYLKKKEAEEVFDVYGIITPTGEFLSCEYGCHSETAYEYCMNEGWLSEIETSESYEKAKDMLYKKGFVFVNEVFHKFYSKYNSIGEMPVEIQNTISKYLLWEQRVADSD